MWQDLQLPSWKQWISQPCFFPHCYYLDLCISEHSVKAWMNDCALFLITESHLFLSSGLQQLRDTNIKDRDEKTSSSAIFIHEDIELYCSGFICLYKWWLLFLRISASLFIHTNSEEKPLLGRVNLLNYRCVLQKNEFMFHRSKLNVLKYPSIF